jgi:hypothetical protein
MKSSTIRTFRVTEQEALRRPLGPFPSTFPPKSSILEELGEDSVTKKIKDKVLMSTASALTFPHAAQHRTGGLI